MASRPLRLAALVVSAVALVLGLGAWTLLRVEDIPARLPPVELDPDAIVIESLTGGPDLAVAELREKTAFFVVVGPQTRDSQEGEDLNRALNRWIFPESTAGFIVFDGEGMGFFRTKAAELMGRFATEMRFPVYVDFEGEFIHTFGLPKGHHGFVVLDPSGATAMRVSGGVSPDELDTVASLLGGVEPPVGPPAPAFEIGELSSRDCVTTACAIVFLGRDIARTEIPGIDGGFDGSDEAAATRWQDPAIRLVSLALKAELDTARGVIVGRTSGLEFEGWSLIDSDARARAAFDVADGDAGIFIVSSERIAFEGRGAVPLYEWGRVADLLGVELSERKLKADGD